MVEPGSNTTFGSHGLRATRLLLLVALGALVGACGPRPFPAKLFTIEAPHADYPVMVSRTQAKSKNARPISAQSGMRASVRQSSYTIGNTHVTVTHSNAARSEMPASKKLAAEVRRTDKWIQLEAAVFTATDFSTYGASSTERLLLLEATAHE